MSRFRRAMQIMASSYLALGAGTCFALVSIPMALHYLSKERFGLWALMASISGYLALIDLGMSASVARLLIDHKDQRSDGTYGSFIQTGWLVLFVQGALLLVVCFALAPWMALLLDIPGNLKAEFIGLMRWQGLLLALSFFVRIFSHLLYAHQRLDLCNYVQVAGLGLNLALLWLFFHAGQGVFSLIWAALIAACAGAAALWLVCWKMGLFPPPGCWGRPSWHFFRELFGFGRDLFLVAVGAQLIFFSQMMVITRYIGLEAAAAWAVGTKAYTLVSQLIWRTTDAPAPGLSEMVARREHDRLLDRYRTVVVFGTSLAVFCSVTYALCNSPFVTIWTAGRIIWSPTNDLLLGASLLVSALVHSHNWFVGGAGKQIRMMPYVFLIEGVLFVLISLSVARHGFPFIIAASLCCSILCTGAYGVFRVARFFQLSIREVAWDWFEPTRKLLWRFTLLAAVIWMATRALPTASRFAIHGFLCGTLGLYLLAKYGLSPNLQHELILRLPAPASRLLQRVLNSFGSSQAPSPVPPASGK